MLRASKTFLSLLSSTYRSCITSPRYIFNSNNVLFHRINYFFHLFTIVTRSRRYGPSCYWFTSRLLLIVSACSCVNSLNFAFSTVLFSCTLHRVFICIAAILLLRVNQLCRWFTAYIQTRCRCCCRPLYHRLLLLLLCCLILLVFLLVHCVQTPVYLDWLTLRALHDCVTRSFLWSVLGTHTWLSLNGSMRTSICMWDLYLLASVLRAALSHNSVSSGAIESLSSTILHQNWSVVESDLWCASNNWPRSRKSLSSASNCLIDELLFNNCRLISRSHILYFVDSLTTARIASQVSDLPDMASVVFMGASLHVVK